MLLALIIYLVACCIESSERSHYISERNNERRHRELVRAVKEQKDREPKKIKRTVRRIAQTQDGTVLAEERTEETEQ